MCLQELINKYFMFVISNFGPAYKYRLEIIKEATSHSKEFIYVLTDSISYNKFYKDLDEYFNFLIIDDIKSEYPLSVKHEILPTIFESEEDQFTNFESFYKSIDNNFSYDIHRFAIPILAKLGIKKFFIVDSDSVFSNNRDDIFNYFNNLPDKSICSPVMGYDVNNLQNKQNFWENLNYNETTKNYKINNNILLFDGWARGFAFESNDDMLEFFDIWNTAYLTILDNRKKIDNNLPIYKNGEGPLIWSNEWVFSHCVDMFITLKNYKHMSNYCYQPGVYEYMDNNVPKIVGIHCPRPEDNLYYTFDGTRGAWYDFKFNFKNQKKIKDFIKDNKDELLRYYQNTKFSKVEITDTHVYTFV